MRVHLDSDFLVRALSAPGSARQRLFELADSSVDMRMSSIAWFEFARGPRTTDELAVARSFFSADGIVPFSEDLAERAAEVFRRLGSPRRRAADIAIGVTAAEMKARLVSGNARDFAGIPDLELEAIG